VRGWLLRRRQLGPPSNKTCTQGRGAYDIITCDLHTSPPPGLPRHLRHHGQKQSSGPVQFVTESNAPRLSTAGQHIVIRRLRKIYIQSNPVITTSLYAMLFFYNAVPIKFLAVNHNIILLGLKNHPFITTQNIQSLLLFWVCLSPLCVSIRFIMLFCHILYISTV
jgi:hypothetical protein